MNKPLSGIKVLDFTRFFAGPYCAMLLGDYGADVIKLEAPDGDSQRTQGPPFVGDQSTGFMAVNRNKRGIAINLKTDEGKEIAQSLAQKVDVIVENFRPGVGERLGIGFEDVAKLNPEIVYCRIAGYGRKGPEAHKPAFDLTVQAFSGFMSINGVPDGVPVKPGISIMDLVTGLHAFAGIQGALLRRASGYSDGPQLIDTSLFECSTALLTDAAVDYWLTGKERQALASHHPNIAPYGAFRAKDGWLTIGAGHDHMWKRLCEVIKRPELLECEQYKTTGTRWQNRQSLYAHVEGALGDKTVAEWVQEFLAAGIPAAPVNSVGSALSSEQAKANHMVVDVEHPRLGAMRLVGPAVKQPGIAPETWNAPPMLGEHTREVLRDLVGLRPEMIADLERDKVIFCGSPSIPNMSKDVE